MSERIFARGDKIVWRGLVRDSSIWVNLSISVFLVFHNSKAFGDLLKPSDMLIFLYRSSKSASLVLTPAAFSPRNVGMPNFVVSTLSSFQWSIPLSGALL